MTNQATKIRIMTIAALLGAIGYLIPTISPFKIKIEPASFTFASHVPIMIGMYISPLVGIFVALITSTAFISFGPVVVLRALSHLIFVTIGATLLKKNNKILHSKKATVLFAVLISLIHAVAEIIVSSLYFSGVSVKEYAFLILGLVGAGTFIHSLVDFTMALLLWKPLQRIVHIPVNAKVGLK